MKDDEHSQKKFKLNFEKKRKKTTLTQCPCMMQIAIPKDFKGLTIENTFPKTYW